MIVRDSDLGMQVFMMKRSLRSNFGGIWVFPGGILEDQDQDIAKKNYFSGINEKKAKAILGGYLSKDKYLVTSTVNSQLPPTAHCSLASYVSSHYTMYY